MINKHKEGSTSSSVQEGSVMKQMNTNDTGSFAYREDRLLVEYKTNIGNTRSLEFIVKAYK